MLKRSLGSIVRGAAYRLDEGTGGCSYLWQVVSWFHSCWPRKEMFKSQGITGCWAADCLKGAQVDGACITCGGKLAFVGGSFFPEQVLWDLHARSERVC